MGNTLKDRILTVALPAGLAALLLLIWQFLSTGEVIPSALFPPPSDILKEVFIIQGLREHMVSSVWRLMVSVGIGFLAGLAAGVLVGLVRFAGFIEDVISFFMSIPGISWAPLFIVFIGFGNSTILAVGILTAFFPMVYNVQHGLREVDPNLVNLGKTMEFSPARMFLGIRLPAIMNFIVTGLKLSFARTWRTIIAVEMIAASTSGLGYMIFDSRELLNTRVMFAGIILSGFIYIFVETVILRILEKGTVERWGMRTSHE
jgi:ABC-type nitrate/sulfonate/bicarbonate transport system permease component